jgi:hypothetical protein
MNDELSPALNRHPALGVPRSRGARWRGELIAVIALLLLPLLVFLPAALLRGVFYIHDVQYYFYPYHVMPAALLARGELPLWNPYAFSGIPLVGDGQTALFYPPNWLFFALPGGAALNYDVLLQFGIAGAGMYLFARALGLARPAALVGAISFMFCGFLTARVVHLSIQSGAALIPLVFLCVEKAFQATDERRATTDDRRAATQQAAGGRRSLAGRRNGWFVAAAVAVGLHALAGHPQLPVYTALALGLYALVRAAARWVDAGDARALYRLPLTLAGIYLLGYALAAIQLAPWVELGTYSPRAAGASFDFVFGNSMVGSDWLLLLFPYLYGSLRPGPYGSLPLDIGMLVKTWEHSAYVGILPLGLAAYALLGLFQRPTERPVDQETGRQADRQATTLPVSSSPNLRVSVLFFGLLLIGAVLFAAGKHTPLANLIYSTPVIGKLRDVERAMALADFALAALAALGMQRLLASDLLRGARRGAWRPSLLLIAAATVLLPAAIVYLSRRAPFQRAMLFPQSAIENLHLSRLNTAVPLALALLSAALLLWWSRRAASRATQALAVGLVLLDVGSYAALFDPLADPQLYQRQPDVLAAFQAGGAPFRKATFLPNNDLGNRAAQETLAVSWGMVYGIEDINGFNSLQPRRYTDYLFGPEVGDVSYGGLRDERLLRPESPILSALNVRYLLVPADVFPRLGPHLRQVYENAEVRVYENTLAYPRAYFAASVRGETDPGAVLRAVTADGFDGRQLALVETDQPPALAPASGQDTVTITSRGANRIALTTDTSAQRFLVLSEMYFPGWRAYVDGAETPIYRTNYLFRGVAVPAGQHTVTFEYRPASVVLGVAISALGLLVSALLVLRRRRPA